MKKILLTIAIFVCSIFFYAIPQTNSYFISNTNLKGNRLESAVLMTFYAREDNKAVGFKVSGISGFDKLTYEITYAHGSISEAIIGEKNLTGENSYTNEWTLLGSCTSGGVCIFHDVFGPINLTVNLERSGIVEKTLSQNLSL